MSPPGRHDVEPAARIGCNHCSGVPMWETWIIRGPIPMFGWLKLKHKLIALAALMSVAQIASAFSTFVLVRRQVEAETLATATKNGQLLVEHGNTLVYSVVMDSRGVYMSSTWEEASPFADRILQSLAALTAVARRLSLDGP